MLRYSTRMTNSNYSNWKKGKISEDVYKILCWAHEIRTQKGYRFGKNSEVDQCTRSNLIELGSYYLPGCDYGKPAPTSTAQSE